MHSLFDVLLKRRQNRGAIDFDTTETRIVFGKDRKIDKIKQSNYQMIFKLIKIQINHYLISITGFLQISKLPILHFHLDYHLLLDYHSLPHLVLILLRVVKLLTLIRI